MLVALLAGRTRLARSACSLNGDLKVLRESLLSDKDRRAFRLTFRAFLNVCGARETHGNTQ